MKAIASDRNPASRQRGRITRPRLVEAITAADGPSITLISAGPGYGKSALLSDIAITIRNDVAFCQFDTRDRDVTHFLRHFVATIRNSVPRFASGLGDDPAEAITTSGTKVVQSIAGVIADELSQIPTDLTLILDDAHLIGQNTAFESILGYLFNATPPSIRCVVASRGPLPVVTARMRAYQLCQEFTNADLAYTPQEAEALLESHGLKSNPLEVELIVEKTMGWAAGLVMAAHYLKAHPADQRLKKIDAVGGISSIYNFLAEEVLLHEPSTVQKFLLQTSLLSTVTPDSAGLLTDVDPLPTLKSLQSRGLFVQETMNGVNEFRYHPLFREFLQTRLEAMSTLDELCKLHLIAARAMQECEDWSEAFRHYIAASDKDSAVEVVEAVGPEYLEAGLFETVLCWIDALPDEVVSGHPAILAQRGRIYHQQGNFDKALYDLTLAFDASSRDGDAVGAASIACELGLLHTRMGTSEKAVERFARIAGSELEPLLEADVLRSLGANLREMGETAAAAERCERAYELARSQTPSIRQERTLLRVARSLGIIYLVQGHVAKAIATLEDAVRYDTWRGDNEIEYSWSLASLGTAYCCAGEFEKALEALQNSEALTQPHIRTRLDWIHLWRGRIYRDQGKFELADEQFALVQEKAHADVAYLRLLQGEHSEALLLARRAHSARSGSEAAIERARATATLGIALARKTLFESAEIHLDQAQEVLSRLNSKQHLASLLLQRAMIKLDSGAIEAANELLRTALTHARENDYQHFFWWNPDVIAALCAHALESGIEVAFTRELAAKRLGAGQSRYFQQLLCSEQKSVRECALSILQEIGKVDKAQELAITQILGDCNNPSIREGIGDAIRTGILNRSIIAVLRNRYALTWKEIEVFSLYYLRPSTGGAHTHGNLRRECAKRLFISENTMRAHVKNIRLKLDLPGETGTVSLRDWLVCHQFLAA